ncbi:MAG: GDCCVxC domain-containing (seleno)protein [Gammaproteobacteria bacterium]
MPDVKLNSTIGCPNCGSEQTVTMPTDACIYFYSCPSCGTILTPKTGDCCVFCSFGNTPCPPIQENRLCNSF